MRNILLLLRKQLYEDKKGLIIYVSVVFGFLLIPNLIAGFVGRFTNSYDEMNYVPLFINLLLVGGFIMVSITYAQEMYSKVRQHAWLMLPVHAHEKLIAKFIYHAVLYPLALLIFVFLSSVIIEGMNAILFKASSPLLDMTNILIWKMILHYMVLQSIFLLGATYFKSAHLVKTVLSLMILSIVLSLILALIARIVYAPYAQQLFHGGIHIDDTMVVMNARALDLGNTYATIGKTIYWALLAPFCLVVSYFRIREVEAKDAV